LSTDNMRKGKALQPGDTFGVVAPSSPACTAEINEAHQVLRSIGFKVVFGASCYAREGGYLAGKPELRAKDIQDMFMRDDIDGILCLRGGYGSPQLLPLLDYELIRHHPKVFIGYSDITALHTVLGQRCGFITFHGPMLTSDMAQRLHPFAKQSLFQAVQEVKHHGRAVQNPAGQALTSLVSGEAHGRLTGGNLTLLCATLGTPYEIDTSGKIVFLEDIGEEPYRIDRMMNQLDLAGKLEPAAGFVIGDFNDCASEKYKDGFTTEEVLRRYVTRYGQPVLYGLKAGHCSPAVTLPFGVRAHLDGTNSIMTLEEPAVI
jgi:muramoyltetrapeptide carboxypeptidase